MKKLLFASVLAVAVAGTLTSWQATAATIITNSSSASIDIPSGFMMINNDEIETIEFAPGSDNVVFKGKGGQQPGKVVKGRPTGRQGGHMTVFEDYKVAGLSGGNVIFYDDATAILYITEVTEDEITITSQTTVTQN